MLQSIFIGMGGRFMVHTFVARHFAIAAESVAAYAAGGVGRERGEIGVKKRAAEASNGATADANGAAAACDGTRRPEALGMEGPGKRMASWFCICQEPLVLNSESFQMDRSE
uniref:Uncharacterized protein n=1 Tax=Chrysotila carterae TaxID=13221 RepID=A0A7S4EVQ3_CHRCT|mmetsp:Transcript_5391/g.11712  ORF Transcript_5391/g.11712 Transcript_5391/m.11712 type:complete len:112 (+) Transcript_5391:313-648(+)